MKSEIPDPPLIRRMGCGDPGLLVGGDTPSALKAGGGEADWAMSRGGTPGEGGDMARRFEDDNSFTGLKNKR